MRIGLDLRMLGGGAGIDRYITELSHAILKSDKQNEYVLFFRNSKQAEAYKAYGQKIVIKDIAHYSVAEQLVFPGILNKENLDLVHFPHFNVPLWYNKKFIVTIHDLTHTLIPGKKKARFFYRIAYRMVFKHAVKAAYTIIAVSEATKKDLLDYYKDISPDKVKIIYEGVNQIYGMMDKAEAFTQVSNRFKITKPYILYVGAWRRYKNLPMLVRAFDKLVSKGHDLELVLAGESDPFYPEITDHVMRNPSAHAIRTPGRVTDEELKQLYNAATLFVLPSLMEGFGLPVLEAASCGIPLALSDIPSLREVAGQGAEYFDPNNLDNMVDVMDKLLKNPVRLEELANSALNRVKHFSWEKAAKETLEAYL